MKSVKIKNKVLRKPAYLKALIINEIVFIFRKLFQKTMAC